MGETDSGTDDFEFDPDQPGELSRLAEDFIHEEVDEDLFEVLDRDYVKELVDCAESEAPANINTGEYEAAIEVAELIVDRRDATDR